MSEASANAVNRGRDMLSIPNVWDASESMIVDAITDLLHLAWVGTNDDGEGMLPEDLIERALYHFRAEGGEGDDIANDQWYTPEEEISRRRDRLTRALTNFELEVVAGRLPSGDPLHVESQG